MANYGDNYNYVVSFDTQGLNEATRATDAVKALDKATDEGAAAARGFRQESERLRDEFGRFIKTSDQAAQSAARQAVAVDRLDTANEGAAASSKNFGAVMGGLAPAIAQGAQLFDDLQYGTRAAAGNLNLLVSAAGGFTPVAMAAGGAVQVLVTLFKDSIDPMLAAAGILDENLVKGMQRAAGSTDAFTAAQERLLATLPGITVGIKEQSAQVADLAKKLEGTQAKRLAEQAVLEETQYRVNDLALAQRALLAAEAERQRLMTVGPAADPGGRRMALAIRQRDNAQADMEAIAADRQRFAEDRFATQVARAGTSEQAALEMVQRLGGMAQRTGNQDLKDLSDAIYRLTDRFKAEEAAREQAKKDQEQRERDEADFWEREQRSREEQQREAERRAKDEQRAQEQAQQQADLAAEAAARPVAEGAGASMEADIMGGKDPAAAAADLMQQLRTLGFTIEEAFSMAARVTEEVHRRVQERVRAESLRNMQRWNGMNTWNNNRPGWP